MFFRMMKSVLCCVFICGFAFVPVGQAQDARVLIVGDSWAEFQWIDGVHAAVFAANGYPTTTADGASTAIGGTTAEQWVDEGLDLLSEAIAENASIDVVQLTIGGNDFLGAWNDSLSSGQEQALQNSIVQNIETIIAHVLAQRSDIEVVLSFYDYLNFEDAVTSFCGPLYQDIGQPTTLRINTVMRAFEQDYAQIAASNPRVYYVSHFGLLQSTYGFPTEGVQPGDITPPGDINRPSPVESLRDIDGNPDCIHLNPAAYQVVIQNLFDGYFEARFDRLFKSSFDG